MAYMSEAAKVRDLPEVMQYIRGRIADIGAGNDPITSDAYALDGRNLPLVSEVMDGLFLTHEHGFFDTIFSSHFLEHIIDPGNYIRNWHQHLNQGGHIVLYLPQRKGPNGGYDNHENLEHCWNWDYDDFMFWFRRSFCGEGKDYKGNHLPKMFEVVLSSLHLGPDQYSFYLIAIKI